MRTIITVTNHRKLHHRQHYQLSQHRRCPPRHVHFHHPYTLLRRHLLVYQIAQPV